jgi:NAD+-dependent protein deacetylase sirtuin 4
VELHGYLRAVVCLGCGGEVSRDVFQEELARLNPAWAAFLEEAIATGWLDTHGPRRDGIKMRLRTNPDGDVDLPDAPYTTFRYPPCPRCLAEGPRLGLSQGASLEVDQDGAWKEGSTAGILKPAVVMFGENIPPRIKMAAEEAVMKAGKLLVVGTSLATASAWTLARRAKDRGMPVAIVNIGGVRGEDHFHTGLDGFQSGEQGVRVEIATDTLLPAVVERLRELLAKTSRDAFEDRDESSMYNGMSP